MNSSGDDGNQAGGEEADAPTTFGEAWRRLAALASPHAPRFSAAIAALVVTSAANLALPVELTAGGGTFAPLEIVWTSELGVPLPLRKPRKPKS